MSAVALDVEPAAYDAASRVLGLDVAAPLAVAVARLSQDVAGCAGMAGCDESGQSFAASYDPAAVVLMRGVVDAIDACYGTAALLQQSGFNHAAADAASVEGSALSGVDRTRWADYRAEPTGPPPPALGPGDGSLPGHWWLIEHAVGRMWPNGHQGRLRQAAAAWRAAGDALEVAAWGIPDAVAALGDQRSPEVPRIVERCDAFHGHLRDLGGSCDALASACEQYAQVLDECHAATEHAVADFVRDSAAIQAGGALFSVVTLGASEALAQAGEGARIAALAARVAALIRTCVAAVEVVADALRAAVAAAGRAVAALGRLRDVRITVAAVSDSTGSVRTAMAVTRRTKEISAARSGTRAAEVRSAMERGSRAFVPSAEQLASDLAQIADAAITLNKGGWTVRIAYRSRRDLVIRVMERGGGRTNYYRISIDGGAAFTAEGIESTDLALTHIPITSTSCDDIVGVIEKVRGAR